MTMTMTKSESAPQTAKNQNQSIARACFIFDLFTETKDAWSLSEIAAACQTPVTTMQTVLNALEASGYLRRVEETKRYKLGVKFIQKGILVSSRLDLSECSIGIMRQLNQQTGWNVHLGVLEGGYVFYVNTVFSTRNQQLDIWAGPAGAGRRNNAHATALGKAMLAYTDLRQIYGWRLDSRLDRYTDYTITDMEALEKELYEIRCQGYATECEENVRGGMCVAAPIFNYQETVIAAVSVSMPKIQENVDRIQEYIRAVVAAAAEISSRMGSVRHRACPPQD